MRHGIRHLLGDLVVLTVAAYLQAMALVRCASAAIAETPWSPAPHNEPAPEHAAGSRGRIEFWQNRGVRIGNRRLVHVGSDPTTGHPAAYLADDRGVCQLSLFIEASLD
jgi:hypothetical protein